MFLTLTVSMGYLERLLGNVKIEKYLERYHLDILQTLKKSYPTARQPRPQSNPNNAWLSMPVLRA